MSRSDAPDEPGSPSVSFSTTLSAFGNNTGIEVPDEVIQQLGAGNKPAVTVTVNGYRYRNTVGVMGGKHLLSVSAAIRKETGLAAGDPIAVTVQLETTPREVVVPDDLAAALEAAPSTRPFFDGLSNSMQRFHIDTINSAKTDETRARRVAKAVDLFRAGKQR